jgi:hypothetical protein
MFTLAHSLTWHPLRNGQYWFVTTLNWGERKAMKTFWEHLNRGHKNQNVNMTSGWLIKEHIGGVKLHLKSCVFRLFLSNGPSYRARGTDSHTRRHTHTAKRALFQSELHQQREHNDWKYGLMSLNWHWLRPSCWHGGQVRALIILDALFNESTRARNSPLSLIPYLSVDTLVDDIGAPTGLRAVYLLDGTFYTLNILQWKPRQFLSCSLPFFLLLSAGKAWLCLWLPRATWPYRFHFQGENDIVCVYKGKRRLIASPNQNESEAKSITFRTATQ